MPRIRPCCAALIVCSAAVLTVACSRPEHAEAKEVAVTVAVAKATRADLAREVTLTAEFKPFQEVDLMAKVAGYVKKINVDVGDRVKQGQLLAVLEMPEQEDDLAR